MKYVLALCLVLLVIFTGLSQSAVNPQNYTGQWYSADNQSVYLFQNGLIYCSKYPITLSDTESINGAYSFSKNSIFLFSKGIEDLETETELFFVRNREGSFLCENADGTGKIYFIRYQE